MRINVYHEELTYDADIVEKHVPDTGNTYYGARLFLKSAPELHHTPDDDDRTAITFWFGDFETAEQFAMWWAARDRRTLEHTATAEAVRKLISVLHQGCFSSTVFGGVTEYHEALDELERQSGV